MKRTILLLLAVVVLGSCFAWVDGRAYAAGDVPPGFPCKQLYSVRSGDTLFKISERFSVAPLILMWMNNLTNPAVLYPGDTLCVKYYVVAGTFYSVRAGDNLTKIAQNYDSDAEYLAQVNVLQDENSVFDGQVIFIPRGKKYFR